MASYSFLVQKLSGSFEGCEFLHVPRAENEAADTLAKIASSRQAIPSGVSLEHLRKPSVKPSPDSESIDVPDDPAASQPGPGNAQPGLGAAQLDPATIVPDPAVAILTRGLLNPARGLPTRMYFTAKKLKQYFQEHVVTVGCEFLHVPRAENEAADTLAKIASSRQAIPSGVSLEHLRKPSVKPSPDSESIDVPDDPAASQPGPGTAEPGLGAAQLDPATIVPDPAVAIPTRGLLNPARGLPTRIITDNGTNFTKGALEQYCSVSGIRLDLASVAHPQSNGQVERANGLILSRVKP
ncbi:uncharacterized protein [Aegilops tauschii subsp. strangulata]|uniref:uncharacterized protein n=1 Tax=Aegilops tauschii subsp. strangulata TaxID=200361 RepID=UPI001ABC85A3